ncbi:unnamed protein product [Linum trigynum]|uniref:Uncharacterized protein n=1 Tax=Linum trigynum TaxID=586398 RepID=A0AAV2G834_9ROSI
MELGAKKPIREHSGVGASHRVTGGISVFFNPSLLIRVAEAEERRPAVRPARVVHEAKYEAHHWGRRLTIRIKSFCPEKSGYLQVEQELLCGKTRIDAKGASDALRR